MKEKFYSFVEAKLVSSLLFAFGMILSPALQAEERISVVDSLRSPSTLHERMKTKDIEIFRNFIKQKYQVEDVSDRDLGELLNETEIDDFKAYCDRNYISSGSPGPSCAC